MVSLVWESNLNNNTASHRLYWCLYVQTCLHDRPTFWKPAFNLTKLSWLLFNNQNVCYATMLHGFFPWLSMLTNSWHCLLLCSERKKHNAFSSLLRVSLIRLFCQNKYLVARHTLCIGERKKTIYLYHWAELLPCFQLVNPIAINATAIRFVWFGWHLSCPHSTTCIHQPLAVVIEDYKGKIS